MPHYLLSIIDEDYDLSTVPFQAIGDVTARAVGRAGFGRHARGAGDVLRVLVERLEMPAVDPERLEIPTRTTHVVYDSGEPDECGEDDAPCGCARCVEARQEVDPYLLPFVPASAVAGARDFHHRHRPA